MSVMSIEIVVAGRGSPPFPVELIAFEEDTYLVLSAGNLAREIREETSELLGEMSNFDPLDRGTVLKRGQRLYVVVHDLDHQPSCDKRIVMRALKEIVRICNEGGIHSIAIEPLGCTHGQLDNDWFLNQLKETANDSTLRRIWVYE